MKYGEYDHCVDSFSQSGSWNWLEAMFYSCQDATHDHKMIETFRMSNFVS